MKAEFIREICLSFPGAKEDIKWEQNLCFLVQEKMFCITDIESDFGVSLKVKEDEFDALTSRMGISPAPYLARYKWIRVNSQECFTMAEWKHFLGQSYQMVKAKLSSKQRKKIA